MTAKLNAAGLFEYRSYWDGEAPIADAAGVSKFATKNCRLQIAIHSVSRQRR
jgi:hypothetical protein